MDAITIGLDIAKSVFHVHVADSSGKMLQSKKLRRSQMVPFFARLPRAVVGIEACGTAHHWARRLSALGHEGAAERTRLATFAYCCSRPISRHGHRWEAVVGRYGSLRSVCGNSVVGSERGMLTGGRQRRPRRHWWSCPRRWAETTRLSGR